jgi:RNAse (barnase) inhibitor barstar
VSVADWVDLAELMPGLRGQRLHVAAADDEGRIAAALRANGFAIRMLEGERIIGEPSFFEEAARGLELPSYFGRNWDALHDCLGDWHDGDERRIGVLWRDADQSLAHDAQTVFRAALAFAAAATPPPMQPVLESTTAPASTLPPLQLEVFLLGEAPGFHARG